MADQDRTERTQTIDLATSLNAQTEPRDGGNTAAVDETLAAEPAEAISISSVSATSLEPDVSLEHTQTAED